MSESLPESPTTAQLRVPPHSIEAELSVLGGLMLNNDAWFLVADKIEANDFYRPAHKLIFEVMFDLANTNEPLDVVTISEALASRALLEKVGGNAYLAELVEGTPGTSNISAYADIVKERAVLRQLIDAAHKIAETAYLPEGRPSNDLLNEAEQRVFEISEGRIRDTGPQRVVPLLTAAVSRMEQLYQSRDPITGLATGFEDLDKKTAGFQRADLVILAARPSMGKTAMIVNMAEHAVMSSEDGGAVLIFSMEQPADQLIMRMLSSLGRIDQTRMRTGDLSDEDWPRFTAAVAQLRDRPLYIDDTPALTPNDVRTRARRVAREAGGLDMIMVDYLQLMRGSSRSENRATEISEISRTLKAIAKELNCPLVACSQLNRSLESRENKRPHMSDLRESGAIEQDADIILFIYRDEVYNPETEDRGLAELIIAKQRNGPIGTVKLTFTGNLTKFDNYVADDRLPDFGGFPTPTEPSF